MSSGGRFLLSNSTAAKATAATPTMRSQEKRIADLEEGLAVMARELAALTRYS